MEAHPGALETHPGALESHSGAMEAHPGAVEAGGCTDKKENQIFLSCKVIYEEGLPYI